MDLSSFDLELVTACHNFSQLVTACHNLSQLVTNIVKTNRSEQLRSGACHSWSQLVTACHSLSQLVTACQAVKMTRFDMFSGCQNGTSRIPTIVTVNLSYHMLSYGWSFGLPRQT